MNKKKKEEIKNIQINIKVTKEEKRKIEELAKKEKRSVSNLIVSTLLRNE